MHERTCREPFARSALFTLLIALASAGGPGGCRGGPEPRAAQEPRGGQGAQGDGGVAGGAGAHGGAPGTDAASGAMGGAAGAAGGPGGALAGGMAGTGAAGAGGASSGGAAVAGSGGATVSLAPAGSPCVPGQSHGDPLPRNRQASLVRGGFAFTEGPVWIAGQRALFFTEFRGTGTDGRVHKYTPSDGRFSVLVDGVGVNGLAADPDGQIVAGAHDQQRVARLDPATGARSAVPGGDRYQGRPFNQVNDVVVRGDGNIYFSDPDYQLGGRQGQGVTAFYRLSPAGVVTRIGVAPQPNGINLSLDGRTLYVASSGGAPLRRYRVAEDGAVDPAGAQVSGLGSDGMTLDCAGNLYLTWQGRVHVLAPGGTVLGEITGFQGGTTNVAFGGEDHRTLFITAGGGLYQIRMAIPGLPN